MSTNIVVVVVMMKFFFFIKNLSESTFFRKVLYSHKIQAAMSHQRKHINIKNG